MSLVFLAHHPYVIRRLDPQWNVFDTHYARTKRIHYTNTTRISLRSPGSVPTNPLRVVRYFRERCHRRRHVRYVEAPAMVRSYARHDLLRGNYSRFGGRPWPCAGGSRLLDASRGGSAARPAAGGVAEPLGGHSAAAVAWLGGGDELTDIATDPWSQRARR